MDAGLRVLMRDRRHTVEPSNNEQPIWLTESSAVHAATVAALEKARIAAETANAAKTRYLVGVSHEIRSPLNAIYGYAQLLERKGAIEPEDAARVIRRSCEHLINIVDGLLDISRIESGVQKLNRDIVPLPEFLEAIVALVRVEAEVKGLRFDYQASPNLPTHVRCDEKRLRQVLVNLLFNAVKYTPTGTVALKVRYRGLIAEFEISDTGIGIAPQDLDAIFEPFNRGSSDAALSQPGTGLGLAITRVLAEVMGGDVSVSSTVGTGSVFRLRLMLAEVGTAPAPTARRRTITGYAGRRRTILIVDDDPAQLAVLQGLLQPLGFTVYAASGGNEAIALAARCHPDLVLLDIQMRGLTGWDVAQRLRALDQGGRLKILIVSANAHEFAVGGDGAAAHDGFVLKPVELDTLLDAVADQLGIAWDAELRDPAPAAPPIADLGDASARLDRLRHLGRIGHVRDIDAGLDALAADVPASAPLVEQLRGHLRNFDLKSFLALLDKYG
jgi:signal transduction histidine kinase/CheY-like chemotaxis protein